MSRDDQLYWFLLATGWVRGPIYDEPGEKSGEPQRPDGCLAVAVFYSPNKAARGHWETVWKTDDSAALEKAYQRFRKHPAYAV